MTQCLTVILLIGATIEGRVIDDAGQPVSEAVVSVSTGKPKSGPSTMCPSCYADCGKRSRTDADGNYRIDGVSSKLDFTLTAGAPGFAGTRSDMIDPSKDKPELTLTRLADKDPGLIIGGMVLDPDGQPLPGAYVDVGSVEYGNRVSGPRDGITPITVTDGDGKFAIVVTEDVTDLQLEVTAPGCCEADAVGLKPGRDDHVIGMKVGAAITGRLVHEGKGVAGIQLSICQKQRTVGSVLTPETVYTDADGRFTFDHLPPAMTYVLGGLPGNNVPTNLPACEVELPADGKVADFGDIELQVSQRISVRFVAADKQPLPGEIALSVSQDDVWGGYRATVDPADGDHVVPGVTPEKLKLYFRVRGYEVTKTDPWMQQGMNREYFLRPDGDVELTVTLRPVE